MSDSPHAASTLHQSWRSCVAPYTEPNNLRSAWQVANSMIPYLLLWAAMYWSLSYSYWLTLALLFPTAGFLVRIFIISHDCGHGAFFKQPRLNTIVGSIASFLCCSPYGAWRHEHALHHASAGNLDRRGHGDIWTMTVAEYMAAPRRTRLAYRLYRNPIVLFAVGALYIFVVDYRFSPKGSTDKVRKSVTRMNLALALTVLIMTFTIGLPAFLVIQLPIFLLAAAAGSWLFYVQHQFEDVYWAPKDEWDHVRAAMDGSSYYKLPRVLQWFSGNIGFHHIHHLSSKIPNYNLERCHRENAIFQTAREITLLQSLGCLKFRLYDEEAKTLVGFKRVRSLRKAREAMADMAASMKESVQHAVEAPKNA